MAGNDQTSPNAPKAAPRPEGQSVAALPFRSVEEVPRVLTRLATGGVELDDALRERVEAYFRSPYPAGDAAHGIAWLDEAETLIKDLRDHLDLMSEELIAKQAEFEKDLRRELVTDPQAMVRAELNQLRGTRFKEERSEWTRRTNENIAALREKQERQAQKLQPETSRPNPDSVVVRPAAEWWVLYTRWQGEVFDASRKHFASLLADRWSRFVDREVRGVSAALEKELRFELPVPDLELLPNPMYGRRGGDPMHYRDAGTGGAASDDSAQAPEEVIDLRNANTQRASSGVGAAIKQFGSVAAVPIALAIPGGGNGAKIGVGLGVAAAGLVAGHLAARKERERVAKERAEKAGDVLRKKLIDDFRRRLERYRIDVDRFQREYASSVQQLVMERLQEYADAEFKRRGDLLPQQRKAHMIRQREIRDRMELLTGALRTLHTPVLVDLETRRTTLREELVRKAQTALS